MSLIEAWFDGCCEPKNPGGHASYGALIKLDGVKLWEEGQYVGNGAAMSNNVAEYAGCVACLQHVLDMLEGYPDEAKLVKHVHIRGDSKLVINQLQKKWRVNGGLYFPYYKQAKRLLESLSRIVHVTFTWIPRDENSECDVLSKGRLHERGIKFKIQPEKPCHSQKQIAS